MFTSPLEFMIQMAIMQFLLATLVVKTVLIEPKGEEAKNAAIEKIFENGSFH